MNWRALFNLKPKKIWNKKCVGCVTRNYRVRPPWREDWYSKQVNIPVYIETNNLDDEKRLFGIVNGKNYYFDINVWQQDFILVPIDASWEDILLY